MQKECAAIKFFKDGKPIKAKVFDASLRGTLKDIWDVAFSDAEFLKEKEGGNERGRKT